MLNLEVGRGSVNSLNWGWFFLRFTILSTILTTLFLSQRFWYRSIWRLTANWGTLWLRVLIRLAYIAALVLIILATLDSFRMGRHGHLVPRGSLITVLAGLWFFSAVLAYLAVKLVRAVGLLWTRVRHGFQARSTGVAAPSPADPTHGSGRVQYSGCATRAAELLPAPAR